MTKGDRIVINSEVLEWAIKESGKDESEIFMKYPKVSKWTSENEESLPTFKQVEKFAHFLKIPFGYFFLNSPPKKFELSAEYRSINNIFPNASKDLRDTIIEMSRNQDWLINYREELGYEYLQINKEFDSVYNSGMDSYDTAKIIVDLIELDYQEVEKMNSSVMYFNYLRDLMENMGISVFQNGVVGNNTHRKLNIEEFRAFVLIDEIAPIIFINTCDSVTGKIFSIIHEFVHILLGEDDIITFKTKNERYINEVTSEILAPKDYLIKFWDNTVDYIDQIDEIHKNLKISREAIALKLFKLGIISNKEYLHIREITKSNVNKKNRSGGNYYNNLNSKLSENFKRDVISSIESNRTSYTEGFRLLGNIRAKAYDNLKETIYGS